jgi:hypothetical protein
VKTSTADTGSIANAKLIIEQTNAGGITSVELVHLYANTLVTDSDSTYTDQDYLNTFTWANLSGGSYSITHEATMKTSGGTGYAQLWNNTDSAVQADSEITTIATDYERVRSGDLTMPTGAHDMDVQLKNSATDTTSVADSELIIGISYLGQLGPLAIEQQINVSDQIYSTTTATHAPTDNSLGMVLFDGTKLSGESVYLEAVLHKTDNNKITTDVGRYSDIYCVTATDCKMVYYDATMLNLRFKDCDDATCSTGTMTVIDGYGCGLTGCQSATADAVGYWPKIYCPTASDCKVVYKNYNTNDFYFTDCDNAACSLGTVTLLDGGPSCSLTGCSSSVSIINSAIDCSAGATDCKIAYSRSSDLYMADCDNATCSSGTTTLLDGNTGCGLTGCQTADDAGTYPEIDCTNGAADCKIAYINWTERGLYLADCSNATCSSGTTTLLDGETGCVLTGCQTADDMNAYRMGIDCINGTDDCKISYGNDTEDALFMADCSNAACTAGTTTRLDGEAACVLTGCSSGDIAYNYSAIDCSAGSSDCKISYYNGTDSSIYFADCANAGCTSGTTTLVDGYTGCTLTGCDTAGSRGGYIGMDCLSATDCKIAYYESTGGSIWMGDCDDATCSTGTAVRADGEGPNYNVLGYFSAIDCPTADNCKMAYLNYTDTAIQFMDCDDATCSSGMVTVLDGAPGCMLSGCSDWGTATGIAMAGIDIDCPSANDCKVTYYNDDKAALYMADCDSETCNIGTTTLIDGDAGCTLTNCDADDGRGYDGKNSIDCSNGATDCKIAYISTGSTAISALMLADCDNATCSSGTVRVVDGASGCGLTGCDTARVIGADPENFTDIDCTNGTSDCKITYTDTSLYKLFLADCNDATCSTGNVTLIDGVGCAYTGCHTTYSSYYYNALDCTNGSDDCKISYYIENSTPRYFMKFKDCDNSACTTGTYTILDGFTGCSLTGCSTTDYIYYPSDMDCTNGTDDCKIAYYNFSKTALAIADCSNATCSAGTTTLLDGTSGCVLDGCDTARKTGFYPGIDCTHGGSDCKIAYHTNSDDFTLEMADCDNAGCSTGTTTRADNGSERVWAHLYDDAGSRVADGIVMTQSTSYEAQRSHHALSLTNGEEYSVRIQSSDPDDTIAYTTAARLVMPQTGTTITDTQTQVEVGNNDTTTATSYELLTDRKIYRWDANKFSDSPTVYFEASLKGSDGSAVSYAALSSSATCATTVASSEVSVTGTTWDRQRSASLTLTDDTDYWVCVKTSSADTGSIANAKVVIDQSNAGGITSVELVHYYANTLATDSDSTYTSQGYVNTFDPDTLSGGFYTISHEATMKTSGGTGYAQLYNNTGSAAVTNSAITTIATSDYERVRSSSLTMPETDSDIDVQLKNSATDTTSVSESKLIIGVSSLGIPGSPDTIGTMTNADTANMSMVSDSSGYAHVAFVDDTGKVQYRKYTTAWQTAVPLDSNTGNAYPSLALDTAASKLYPFWIRDNDVYYKSGSSPYGIGNWDGSPTSFYSTDSNYFTTVGYNQGASAGAVFAEWTTDAGTAGAPYMLAWDVRETGPNTAPNAPTDLYVNETRTGPQSGVTNPIAVGDGTPVFSAKNSDPDSGDSATKYEVIVYSDACSTQVWDSGIGGTSMGACTEPNRCEDIEYADTAPLPLDGSTYYWKIRFWDVGGEAGSFSDCTANFTMVSPDDQLKHGDYFFDHTSEAVYSW